MKRSISLIIGLTLLGPLALADDFVPASEEIQQSTAALDVDNPGSGTVELTFGFTLSRSIVFDFGDSLFDINAALYIPNEADKAEIVRLGDGTANDHYILFFDDVEAEEGGEEGGGDGNWAEAQPVGASNQSWRNASISEDGQTILAGVNGGRLWLSTNGGSSWSEATPAGASNQAWRPIAVSGDGQTLMAGVDGGRLYLSTNGGSSWGETQPAGATNQSWRVEGVSEDGQTLLAGTFGGRLYLSSNGGSSWGEVTPAGASDQNWDTGAMSDDGQTILAGIYGGGLYLSTNGGGSWAETQPAGGGGQLWGLVSIDGDGQTLLVPIANGRLWISTNQGGNWSETQPLGNSDQLWGTTSISDDGQRMLALTYGERIYLSTNGGGSWTETQPISDSDYDWLALSISGDGQTMLAGIDNGRIYLLVEPGGGGGGGGEAGRKFGWDDSMNAFSLFGESLKFRTNESADPPAECNSLTTGIQWMDSDTGILYACDTSNSRSKWLSINEFSLYGENSGTCSNDQDVGSSGDCAARWGGGVGGGSSTDLGFYVQQNDITITGYGISTQDNDCGGGSGYDLEIWGTGSGSNDNGYSLAAEVATGLTGETNSGSGENVDIDGDQYILWGLDNNCGSGGIQRWNTVIYYRYRHNNP